MTTKQGDKIQDVTGQWHTVRMVCDNMIYVYGSQNVIHISKVIRVRHAQA